MQTFTVTPSGEFSLDVANQRFGGWIGAADEGDGLVVPMAFAVENWEASAAVLVRQDEHGRIHGDVHGAGDNATVAWQQALAVLSLDADGAGFAEVGRRDRVIGALQRRYQGLRPVLFHSPYEAAAAFVIGHRISVAQGRAIRQRIAREWGEPVATPVGTVHAFPTPQRLLELKEFKSVAAAKMPRLHAVAQAALEGTLDRARLRAIPEAQALEQLRRIPGIGFFFAQGILMRGAGLVDAVTDDDITKQAVQRAYQMKTAPTQATILDIAENWRPYRMWAVILINVWFRSGAEAL